MLKRKFGVLTSLVLGLSAVAPASSSLLGGTAFAEENPPSPPKIDSSVQITPQKMSTRTSLLPRHRLRKLLPRQRAPSVKC
ncbi:hypothetical protein [Asaia astilbis]|uniref:hypothetical protein n=1 Tax=Asaia astilbis TaxID=610244 RepID=UPI000AD7B586|nr:hypothetical protein [Asaia astilbis]